MNVLFFDDINAQNPSLSGGKGSNLARLKVATFRVPDGFIITSKAYESFIAQATFLDRYISELCFDDLEILEKQSARIQSELCKLALPKDIQSEIAKALERFPKHTSFSVRSSSSMEDLSEVSFAGAYDTFLNCVGEEEIYKNIVKCFASLWHTRAIAYRYKQGFSQKDTMMAVVIQEMIDAQIAGASFSINPISMKIDEIVINANYGLGASVVGGEFDVDAFVVSKTNYAIIESFIAEKKSYITTNAQGIITKDTESSKIHTPCLSDEQIVQVARLNAQVERFYGFSQDIEWAIQDDMLYLLQSRPITTIEPLWSREGSADRYPSAITPFTWGYVDRAFHISLRHSLKLMGLPRFNGKWFEMFDNYIYGNQNAVWLYMGQSPLFIADINELREKIPFLLERFRYMSELPRIWERDLETYLQGVGALLDRDLSQTDLQGAWGYIQEVVALGTEYFKPNIAISIAQALLYRFFMQVLTLFAKDRASYLFDAIIATNETKTSLVNEELYNLAQIALKDEKLKECILQQDSKTIIKENKLCTFPHFYKHFMKFLSLHGHREVEFDPYIPTWLEAPYIVLDNIALIMRNHKLTPPALKAQEVQTQGYKATGELLSLMPEDLHLLMLNFIKLVKTYTILDDVEHYETARLSLLLRKGARAFGEILVQRGCIQEPMDIFFAHIDMLEEYVRGEIPDIMLTQEIKSQKQAYLTNKQKTPDWNLESKESKNTQLDSSKEVLQGLAGSAGEAQGEVYLVHSSDDFASFPQGAILVARSTNPSWTPLFYSAKAIITESGGVLSHGAVTAREMKLPAVMGVRDVMNTLRNGQKVLVNGNVGKVYILE